MLQTVVMIPTSRQQQPHTCATDGRAAHRCILRCAQQVLGSSCIRPSRQQRCLREYPQCKLQLFKRFQRPMGSSMQSQPRLHCTAAAWRLLPSQAPPLQHAAPTMRHCPQASVWQRMRVSFMPLRRREAGSNKKTWIREKQVSCFETRNTSRNKIIGCSRRRRRQAGLAQVTLQPGGKPEQQGIHHKLNTGPPAEVAGLAPKAGINHWLRA